MNLKIKTLLRENMNNKIINRIRLGYVDSFAVEMEKVKTYGYDISKRDRELKKLDSTNELIHQK